jgi:hypothetical protein
MGVAVAIGAAGIVVGIVAGVMVGSIGAGEVDF